MNIIGLNRRRTNTAQIRKALSLFSDMSGIQKERRKVCGEKAYEEAIILYNSLPRDSKTGRRIYKALYDADGRCIFEGLNHEQMKSVTNALTAWIPVDCEDAHAWLQLPITFAQRFYSSDFSKFGRKNDAPECVHNIGACDIIKNMEEIYGTPLPEGISMRVAVLVMGFHDLIENNKLEGFTPEEIIEGIDQILRNMGAEPLSDHDKETAILYLGLITDSPEKHGQERLQEQEERNKKDKLGFLPILRIIEKQNALIQDRLDMIHGFVPFSDIKEYEKYIKKRIKIMKKIKQPNCEVMKRVYIQYAKKNLKMAKKLAREAANNPPTSGNAPKGYKGPYCPTDRLKKGHHCSTDCPLIGQLALH